MMKKAMQRIAENKPVVWNEGEKRAIFDFIEHNQKKGKEARAKHAQNVASYKEKLEEMKKQKVCPYCKMPLVLRKGKYGEFYGCPNFPKCKYTLK